MLFVRSHKIDIESQLRPMQNISNESEKMCCRWSLIHFLSKKSEKTDRIFVCAVSAFDNRFSSQWGLWTHNDHMQYCSKAKAQRKKIRKNLLTLYYRDAVLFYARTYTNTHIHKSTEREIQRERERQRHSLMYSHSLFIGQWTHLDYAIRILNCFVGLRLFLSSRRSFVCLYPPATSPPPPPPSAIVIEWLVVLVLH